MFRDRGFDIDAPKAPGRDDMIIDLQIQRILDAMSNGNKTINDVCDAALFQPLQSIDEISYRHETLDDARRNPDVVTKLFEIADEATERHSVKFRKMPSAHVSVMYHNTIEYLRGCIDSLQSLRKLAHRERKKFSSEGFTNLLSLLESELDDDYLKPLDRKLQSLFSGDDAIISADLGEILEGVSFTSRKPVFHGITDNWMTAPMYTINDNSTTLHIEKKEFELRSDLAMDRMTTALRQSAEFVGSFFNMLRNETGFFAGVLNLENKLKKIGMPLARPTLLPVESTRHDWSGLYDVSLALIRNAKVVGSELDTENKKLFVITGANQGGKSTYLRGMGQAYLMAQCGMYVGAESYTSPLRRNLFTHFKREADIRLKSGKLDEELERLSKIGEHLTPGCLVFLNESFSSTNEREGSEIIRQITQAMIENNIEVFSVTHMYIYATAFKDDASTMFLRAQRRDGGERTFKIQPGEPLVTAFGEDIYRQVFLGEAAMKRDADGIVVN
jgi:hypothetical protein